MKKKKKKKQDLDSNTSKQCIWCFLLSPCAILMLCLCQTLLWSPKAPTPSTCKWQENKMYWNWTRVGRIDCKPKCGNTLHTTEQIINNKHLECSSQSRALWCALSSIRHTYAHHTPTFHSFKSTHANHSCLNKRFDYYSKYVSFSSLSLFFVVELPFWRRFNFLMRQISHFENTYAFTIYPSSHTATCIAILIGF